MADCECLGGCIFFNDKMENMPSMAAIMKQNFCKKSNKECARFMVLTGLGKEKVPADLFPNNVTKARQIIAKG